MAETQDTPIEHGSDDASATEGLGGIVEQVRADIDLGHTNGSALDLLRQRASDAGIEVSEDRLAQLAAQISAPH
jgi:hypothetical protein